MIRVITIDREYGSGASEVAEKVARRLGWELWDYKMTEEIARRLDCDCRAVEEHSERRDPLYYRLFKAFLRGSFEGALNAPRLGLVDAECIRQAATQVVATAAKAGNAVIVGRGSAYYLQDRPDVLHVFLYGPVEDKVRRLQAQGTSEQEARDLVESVDNDRAEYIRNYFHVEWPCRQIYDLMINSKIGTERVVRMILASVGVFER